MHVCTVCREIIVSAIMPPKKKALNEPTKKTEQKKKEKIIEVFDKMVVFLDNLACLLLAYICDFSLAQDKTFGLKNKKGKKQQTFVKHVTQQVRKLTDLFQKFHDFECLYGFSNCWTFSLMK